MKKKEQTPADMLMHNATGEEIDKALKLIELLRPCLKATNKHNPCRYQTAAGDKTALGLYRTLKGSIFGGEA